MTDLELITMLGDVQNIKEGKARTFEKNQKLLSVAGSGESKGYRKNWGVA